MKVALRLFGIYGRSGLCGFDGRQNVAASGRVLAPLVPPGRDRVDRLDQLQEGAARQGRREDVALRRANADFAQVHDLLEVFHTFGNDVHAHVVGEVDQSLDDGGRVAVGADGIDEHLVDLDDVDAELEHVGQPAVAGADVVD